MIPWKRTLGWTLCWIVASAAVSAEEPAADALADAALESADALADTTQSAEPAESGGEASGLESAPADAALLEAPDAADAGMEGAPAAMSPDDASDAMPMEAAPAATATGAPPALGAVGWDSEGRQGRIHFVVRGDTLWDISDAYLGTPWVWPSIWKDNGEIENPHLIHPGDRIWITATEMRRISEDEAARMLANRPEDVPAAWDEPAAMEDAVPGMEPAPPPAETRTVRVSAREMTGLISPELYESAASVVDRIPERMMLSQEDDLYIGLGEAEVRPGDEFTLFRTHQRVEDPDTGALLGYHVDLLGWVRVEETFPETSRASIRMSTGEIEVGDRVTPREALPEEIEVRHGPEGVEGKITFFPGRRVLLGFSDFVYLNRGTLDGVEVGSPLEVYREGHGARESARDELVEVPDRVIAKMLVVRAEEQTSVALVTRSDTELRLGDRFRAEMP